MNQILRLPMLKNTHREKKNKLKIKQKQKTKQKNPPKNKTAPSNSTTSSFLFRRSSDLKNQIYGVRNDFFMLKTYNNMPPTVLSTDIISMSKRFYVDQNYMDQSFLDLSGMDS